MHSPSEVNGILKEVNPAYTHGFGAPLIVRYLLEFCSTVAEAAEATGVRCVVAGHLGLDAGLVNLIMERVDTALEEDAGDA